MMKRNSLFLIFLFSISFSTYAKWTDFSYQREISGVSEQWHKILLPEDIYSKVDKSMSDIRVMAIDEKKDTTELPYIIYQRVEETNTRELEMKILNETKTDKAYYFTFELPHEEIVNEISLDFEEENFNWSVTLEGSQDQNEWFTILDKYRILSIKNESTNFKFTKIKCPESKFRFFRLCIQSKKKPHLLKAKIKRNETIAGELRTYELSKTLTEEDKKRKESKIELALPMPLMLSSIQIKVLDSFDYYRPIDITYLADSVQTDKGWRYNYRSLTEGTLNSLEENEFSFNPRIIQKLRVNIRNNDNQILSIGSITAKAYVHELVARFNKPAQYYLIYGNEKLGSPNYDIKNFVNKIPTELKSLSLGEEQIIGNLKGENEKSVFENKIWLWAILIVIGLSLALASIKMMQKKQGEL